MLLIHEKVVSGKMRTETHLMIRILGALARASSVSGEVGIQRISLQIYRNALAGGPDTGTENDIHEDVDVNLRPD